MKPTSRKRLHVGTYETEEGKGRFVGNPQQAKEFYNKFYPGEKVYLVHNEDNQECYCEVEL